MLAIRLQRMGKKGQPSYRVVVSEKKKDMYGRHNEILGNYDPTKNPKTINLKADKIKYWISVGAKPSPTVHNLLASQGIIDDKKVQSWKPSKKKRQEKKKEAEAKNTPKETGRSNEANEAEKEKQQENTSEEKTGESGQGTENTDKSEE